MHPRHQRDAQAHTGVEFKECATALGFPIIRFHDFDEVCCSLEINAFSDEPAVWLGVNKAKLYKLKSGGTVPVDMPEGCRATTRMHLTMPEVEALLPYLQAFVNTGGLLPKAEPAPAPLLVAEIVSGSEYEPEARMMIDNPFCSYPFPCTLESDCNGTFVVGGLGGKYPLADVDLYMVVDGQNIRLK
jgi:hypothetical protein